MSADEVYTPAAGDSGDSSMTGLLQCSPCVGSEGVLPTGDCICCGRAACTKVGNGDVFFVSLHYKGTAYDVPVLAGEPMSQIFDFVQEALDFPRENSRLIHKGRLLRPEDPLLTEGKAAVASGAKIMLVASSAHDVAVVQSSRADPLVKGFFEEERDDRLRRKRAKAAGASAWGTQQDSEYRFGSIKAEFKYLTPTPYDAENFLKKLATDPGIIEIMKTRHFKVGVLTEMSPEESKKRMEAKGTPNMDLLGYNMNAGDMIVLKLRTDNVKGFRPYHDVMNTLIHELTHNVWGPHDHNFWKLFGEIKAQYMRFHQFWSHGGKTATGDTGGNGQFTGFNGEDDDENVTGGTGGGSGVVLGGGSSASGGDAPRTEAARRAQALSAAQSRQEAAQDGGEVVPEEQPQQQDAPAAPAIESTACGTASAAGSSSEVAREAPPEPAGSPTPMDIAADPVSTPAVVSAVASDVSVVPPPSTADAAASAATPMEIDTSQDMDVDTRSPAAASPDESRPEAPTEGASDRPLDTPFDLSAEDLEALGLDGSVVWVSRFTRELDAVCRAAPNQVARGAVELLMRLVRNIVESPKDTKFRQLKRDNPRLQKALFSLGPGSEELVKLLGFEDSRGDAGERVFMLRDAVLDQGRLLLGRELLEQRLSTIQAN